MGRFLASKSVQQGLEDPRPEEVTLSKPGGLPSSEDDEGKRGSPGLRVRTGAEQKVVTWLWRYR